MHHNNITFQLATHFLPKIALRLECLYKTIEQACQETHPVIHHYALKNIIKIIDVIEKPELKSRFLKEFVRIEHLINKTKDTNELNSNLRTQTQMLTHLDGLFGENIHQDTFLQAFRAPQPSSNQAAETYSPQLQFWLESRSSSRQRDLSQWLANLNTLYFTVVVYLKLLRSTAEFNTVDIFNGFYHRPLPFKTNCHLILLQIDKSLGIVPRVQLGHHGLSLRLCDASTMREMKDINAQFELAICQL